MIGQALVLDANILIRAVLGRRVLDLILKHQDGTAFFAADECFADAAKSCRPSSPVAAWIGPWARQC